MYLNFYLHLFISPHLIQKNWQRLKHLSSRCIYPPRKILTDSIFQRGFVSYAMAFICHIGSNFWIPGSKVMAVFPRGGMMINLPRFWYQIQIQIQLQIQIQIQIHIHIQIQIQIINVYLNFYLHLFISPPLSPLPAASRPFFFVKLCQNAPLI